MLQVKTEKKTTPNWQKILDPPYIILIIGGSGSGKTNALLNLISHPPEIDKIYLYVKDPYEEKYQLLINKRESVGLNHTITLKLSLNTQMIRMIFTKI